MRLPSVRNAANHYAKTVLMNSMEKFIAKKI